MPCTASCLRTSTLRCLCCCCSLCWCTSCRGLQRKTPSARTAGASCGLPSTPPSPFSLWPHKMPCASTTWPSRCEQRVMLCFGTVICIQAVCGSVCCLSRSVRLTRKPLQSSLGWGIVCQSWWKCQKHTTLRLRLYSKNEVTLSHFAYSSPPTTPATPQMQTIPIMPAAPLHRRWQRSWWVAVASSLAWPSTQAATTSSWEVKTSGWHGEFGYSHYCRCDESHFDKSCGHEVIFKLAALSLRVLGEAGLGGMGLSCAPTTNNAHGCLIHLV